MKLPLSIVSGDTDNLWEFLVDSSAMNGRDTWCAGCDQMRPPLLMGWAPEGLYRCVVCRKADVIVDPDGKGPRLWAKLSDA
ncbi:hypothetical protein [Mycobacterium paraense]|uniref:hypothetical protein n=1 Tax=Mycobacterium paraense TaxID=767916 RepID=UPI0011547B3C|nr:hypothetical protein [Mycobacterium paraense]